MANRKYKDKETKELEKYIKNNFYLLIYEDIEESPRSFDCNPLEFLKILDDSIKFVRENRENPLAIKRFIKNHFPNKKYLLKKLDEALKREISGCDLTGEQMLHRFSEDFSTNAKAKLEEVIEIIRNERINLEDLDAVLEYSETLSNADEKLIYLMKVKTKSEQNQTGLEWTLGIEKSFAEKIDLEIKKLKS